MSHGQTIPTRVNSAGEVSVFLVDLSRSGPDGQIGHLIRGVEHFKRYFRDGYIGGRAEDGGSANERQRPKPGLNAQWYGQRMKVGVSLPSTFRHSVERLGFLQQITQPGIRCQFDYQLLA